MKQPTGTDEWTMRTRLIGIGAAAAAALVGVPLAVVTAAGADAATLPTSCALDGLTVTCTYDYTGAAQSFTMPVGAEPDVQLTVDGAGAANSYQAYHLVAGGGESTGVVAVPAGTTLTLVVGQQGQGGASSSSTAAAAGGAATYGGGGHGGSAQSQYSGANGGDSGGGGSFVLEGTTALLVAGGAGSTGEYGCAGGTGGGAGDAAPPGPPAQSDSSTTCTSPGTSASGAKPGTSTVGASGTAYADGTPGAGGAGQDAPYTGASRSAVCGGAGGGGGYAGGAGGGGTLDYTHFHCGGGGGGSGYADASVGSVTGQAGAHTGNGQIVLVYSLLPVAPAVTTDPTDQTVVAGRTATFSASASGDPDPTVQWQESTDGGSTFTDVAGATSTSYTTPATTAAESGTELRAVFTNDAGSATSRAAVLTVDVAPTFSTPAGALPGGTVGEPYSTTIHDAGSPAPTDTVVGGALPPGLSLSGDPVLSGTPTRAGTFTFTVRAANRAGSTDRAYAVTIALPASGPTTPTAPVAPTTPPRTLPFTGFDVVGVSVLGLVLVGGGLLVRLAARRRAET